VHVAQIREAEEMNSIRQYKVPHATTIATRSVAQGAVSVALLFLLAGVVHAQSVKQYIVGPNDVLSINVFDHPQLTGKFMVQADGTFTFPLLGRVKVGGLDVQQIEDDVRKRLADGFLKNPQVGVTVEQYRSQQVIITGEVRNPQTLEFNGSLTLMTALARAGSITERAAPEALVMRDGKPIQVDLTGLQSGVLSSDVVLRGGDTVVVPKAAMAFVSGHVVSPGEYPIRKDMTVRQLLSLAGGPTDRGSTGRMQVIRKVGNEDKTLDIELQDPVQPNDTIVVRERFF
jgi:polysaccharide export outer membrane protein